jgi:hypothetical protein
MQAINWLLANQQLLQLFTFLLRVSLKINVLSYSFGLPTGGLGCTFFFFVSFPIFQFIPEPHAQISKIDSQDPQRN